MTITIEQFEQSCGGRYTAPGKPGHSITPEMCAVASQITKEEGRRLADLPSIAWNGESIIQQIETAGFTRNRAIQSILLAAAQHGL